MFLAYKYAKRKYQERQAQETSPPQDAPTSSQTQASPGFLQDASWQPSAARTDDVTAAPVITTDSQSGLIPNSSSSPDNRDGSPHKIDEQPVSSSKNNGEAKEHGKKKEPRTPEEKAAKSRQRKYRYKIIFGLMMPFTLQALDTTIIASALPYIAGDFSQSRPFLPTVSIPLLANPYPHSFAPHPHPPHLSPPPKNHPLTHPIQTNSPN